MKLLNIQEFEQYIKTHHECVYESNDSLINNQLPGICDHCNKDVFLQVQSESYYSPYPSSNELPKFVAIYIECPACRRRSFIKTIQFQEQISHKLETSTKFTYVYRLYKLYRLPISEENKVNKDIPQSYTALHKTLNEAHYCLNSSQYIASAILFRRAIQILAKDVLGAEGKTLFNQLEWLKVNRNLLGIDLTDVFHDNSRIIKDVGNQGAHPDNDPELHDFSKEDANGLHDLFISIVYEVFVKPERLKSLQEELKKQRKLK